MQGKLFFWTVSKNNNSNGTFQDNETEGYSHIPSIHRYLTISLLFVCMHKHVYIN